ncbi:velvet factor-domain-containing protein [Xylariaceae sp. FL0255]|nr:velvet factor-domain-containing protein [Xylariaceae sp. FL0255]
MHSPILTWPTWSADQLHPIRRSDQESPRTEGNYGMSSRFFNNQSERVPVDLAPNPLPIAGLSTLPLLSSCASTKERTGMKRHITFDYNVDFFCYASLEHSRPIANGRVSTPQAAPVLTGFPVAGCCYLDRPEPAGYFLFPDLSVRHEGRYRLVFSLYELIKDTKDLDHDMPHSGDAQLPVDACHRMDMKSDDFTVYSAKKFPGLRTSTGLSRTVADQGCRVRIRRDVRVRKRESNNKNSGNDDHASNAEDQYAKHGATPDSYRARSVSNSSVDRIPHSERRLSNADYGTAPLPYQNGQASGSCINFGGQVANSFTQPTYGPGSSSNPQSTPVSPAQSIFPPGQGINLPPPQSYMNSPYSEHAPRVSHPYNYPPMAPMDSKTLPSRAAVHRSSIGSNMSPNLKPILPAIQSSMPDSSSYILQQQPGQTKAFWPSIERKPIKRSLDGDSHDQHHYRAADSTRVDRPPNVKEEFYKLEYARAGGFEVERTAHEDVHGNHYYSHWQRKN